MTFIIPPPITHLDLFSGIGGFSYAIDQVWENVEHIFCDNDKFCQQVLKKHYPNSKIYGDIRSITSDTYWNGLQESGDKQQTGRDRQLSKKTDILTGGFPCQPFSQAGKRRGTADDRYLWPEMLRVIQLTKPTWVIGENVRGFVTWNEGLVLEQVCVDLEAEGYEVQPLIIPAVAVNAPHRRDRVWIIACHPDRLGRFGRNQEIYPAEGGKPTLDNPERRHSDASDTSSEGLERRINESKRLPRQQNRDGCNERRNWNKNWIEVATFYGTMDDGVSSWMDRCINTIIGIEDYATAIKADSAKDLSTLCKEIQSEKVWQELGGLYSLEQKEILLSLLRCFQEWSGRQNDLSSTSKRSSVTQLRELWHNNEARRSPSRREYQKQFARKLENILSHMSHEMAQGSGNDEKTQEMPIMRQSREGLQPVRETLLSPEATRKSHDSKNRKTLTLEIAKCWDYLWVAYSAMSNRPVELGEFKLSKAQHRVQQLKAYGNSIVPQVAIEIIKTICL